MTLHPDDADLAYIGRQFGKSAGWAASAIAALEALGFPKPRPRITAYGAERGPRRWVRAEVDAWVEARRSGAPLPANDTGPETPDPAALARLRILGKL